MKQKIFFMLPSFENYAGHEIEFVPNLINFSNRNKFDFEFIVPKNNKIKIQNKNSCIENENKNLIIFKFIPQIISFLKNIFNLKKLFSKMRENDIIYLDTQSFPFFLSLICSFLFKKKTYLLLFWIRTEHRSFFRKIIFQSFYSLSKFLFFKYVFVLNENGHLSKYTKKTYNINSVGIPSIHLIKIKNKILNKNKINILCPGVYRYEKYGKNLIKFLKNCQDPELTLTISEKFKENLNFDTKVKINFTKNSLDKKYYLKIYKNSDLIFLPYDLIAYNNRFSGMMYEALSCKKYVFTSKKTLMAKFLFKNNLSEFIIDDWGALNYNKILKTFKDKKIKKKFLNTCNKYLSENNFFIFEKKLNLIINNE